jgi:hypothetical protein
MMSSYWNARECMDHETLCGGTPDDAETPAEQFSRFFRNVGIKVEIQTFPSMLVAIGGKRDVERAAEIMGSHGFLTEITPRAGQEREGIWQVIGE